MKSWGIIPAMESCSTHKPWHDKTTGKTFLKPDSSKCLHYFFYFIDEQIGLGYVRAPTWAPFRLQVYINGHNLLALELKQIGIKYSMIDNASDSLENAVKAQKHSDKISIDKLHHKLDEFAWQFSQSNFFRQKLDPRYQAEVSNNYNVGIEGTRTKHTMGSMSIKMNDKWYTSY